MLLTPALMYLRRRECEYFDDNFRYFFFSFIIAMIICFWGIRHQKRLYCRVCGGKLYKPGGHGAAFIGSGFCGLCITKILK